MGDNLITASIVTYHNNEDDIKHVIDSFLNTEIDVRLFISDNSSDTTLKDIALIDDRVEYIFNNKNLGFGEGHNIAIQKAIGLNSDYHIILNPDVYYCDNVLETLSVFMDENKNVGLVLPKVLYPNNRLQYLCKLLPTPMDLIFRRFLPFKSILKKIDDKYELRFADYNKTFSAPYLSGCFMFIRTSIFKQTGLFDQRFFMYMEDVDLSRRINAVSETVFYPGTYIYHKFEKGSHKSYKLMKYHIKSAITYFNKWGWFYDKKRKEINNKTIKNIKGITV